MSRCIGALAKVQRFIDRAIVAEISDIEKPLELEARRGSGTCHGATRESGPPSAFKMIGHSLVVQFAPRNIAH